MADRPAPRRRRSTSELRETLIASARELFSAKGFSATSTHDIARHAQAAHHLIFKHFGTKAGLFSVAVFEPLTRMLEEQIERIERDFERPMSVPDRIRCFSETLMPALRENRRLLVAYVNAVTFHPEEFRHTGPDRPGQPPLRDYLRHLEATHYHEQAPTQVSIADPVMESRLSFALVFAVSIFQELLFSADDLDGQREHAAIAKLLSHGLGVPLREPSPKPRRRRK